MDKSPEAFRTISEVAEALGTPAHVLRFWESRFPQIRPVKRAGGRRYYRPADVALLTGIKHLLHDEGLTIRGVQKILREQGVRYVASLSGQGDIGHEDDVDTQLIAAMSARPDATDDEDGDYDGDDDCNGEDAPESAMPPLQAVESAQVVALETAIARRDAATRQADPVEPFESEMIPEAPFVVARDDDVSPAPLDDISFETLAEMLRTLPRPLPGDLVARLSAQSKRLESLRDMMEVRLARFS